jgi:hypothetical protein
MMSRQRLGDLTFHMANSTAVGKYFTCCKKVGRPLFRPSACAIGLQMKVRQSERARTCVWEIRATTALPACSHRLPQSFTPSGFGLLRGRDAHVCRRFVGCAARFYFAEIRSWLVSARAKVSPIATSTGEVIRDYVSVSEARSSRVKSRQP